MGSELTIADIAVFPWVRTLTSFYEAGEIVGFGEFREVNRALEAFFARPAIARGANIPARNIDPPK
jgi:GST-like protein